MAIRKGLLAVGLGMLGISAAFLVSPGLATAQCGGHDQSNTHEQVSGEPVVSVSRLRQDVDRLLSDELGRDILAAALLDDSEFMREFITRMMADPEYSALASRMRVETALGNDAAVPAARVRQLEPYACPMHPEVTSSVAGDCPKCGMRLVPVKTADRD
jgi:hypothetical protein